MIATLPPSSSSAELAVIGSILTDPLALAQVEYLQDIDFTHEHRTRIWQTFRSLMADGMAVDLITVQSRLETLYAEDAADIVDLLYEAMTGDFNCNLIASYGRTVMEDSQRRQLMRAGQRTMQMAARDRTSPEHIGMTLMQEVARILSVNPDHHTGRLTYPQVLDLLNEDTFKRMEQSDWGIRTGFPRIDSFVGGFEPGQLILIAGRPGSGKSGLGLSLGRRIAKQFAEDQSGAVDVVTLEMSAIAQARRLIAHQAKQNTGLVRRGFHLSADVLDLAAYKQFTDSLEADREAIGNALGFREYVGSTESLAIYASESKAQHGLRVLVVDQLDLLGDASKDNETARIGHISQALKRLAMRLQIVVICLVQLNREVEKRSDKRPQLADLRYSGRLEQDADMVFGIYRPSYYHPDAGHPFYQQWAELLALKCRDGDAGMFIPLRFISDNASYTDWDDTLPSPKDMMLAVEEKEKA